MCFCGNPKAHSSGKVCLVDGLMWDWHCKGVLVTDIYFNPWGNGSVCN